MPLIEGAKPGSKDFGKNIATEIKAGKPKKQAVAIAYAKARGDSDDVEHDAMVITRHDMSDEGWEKLKGLITKWIDEEKGEDEHKNDAGKPSEEQEWRKEVKKRFPEASSSGDAYFVGTKLIAEWNGSKAKSFIAEKKEKKDEFGEKLDAAVAQLDATVGERRTQILEKQRLAEEIARLERLIATGKEHATEDYLADLRSELADKKRAMRNFMFDSKLDSALEKLDSLKNDADEKQKRIKELSARISSLKSQFVNGQVPKDEIHSKEQEITQLLEERHSLDRIYPRGPFRWK